MRRRIFSSERKRLDRAIKNAGSLVAWFCADDVVNFGAGNVVTAWPERISKNNFAGTGGGPTCNPGSVNGRNAVAVALTKTFNGAITAAASNWTLIAVGNWSGNQATQYLLDAQSGRLIFAHATGNGGANTYSSYYDGSWHDSGVVCVNGAQINSFSLSNGASLVRVNGTSHISTGTYSPVAFGGQVGLWGANGGGADCTANACELVVWRGAMSLGQLISIEQAFASYYRIRY